MKAADDQLTFREWLVRQLTLTRWSAPVDISPLDLAVRLGVRLDVLREAQAKREGELKKRGAVGVVRGRRRYVGHDYADVGVYLPKPIEADWVAICRTLRVHRGTILRSLVHHLLVTPARPRVTSESWVYRGEVLRIQSGGKGLARARARITRGAQIALDHHADSWNVTPTAVIRGIITDFLEGRTHKLKVIAFSELWGDPDRYLHPEKFR